MREAGTRRLARRPRPVTLGFAVGLSAEEAQLGGGAGGREPRTQPGAGRQPSSRCHLQSARRPSRCGSEPPPRWPGRRALCHGRCCCGGLFAGADRPRFTRTRRHGGHAPPPLRSPCPVARGPRLPATTPPSVLALAGRGLAPGSGPAERDSAWRAGRAATPGTSYADRSGWRVPALRPAEETRVGLTVTPPHCPRLSASPSCCRSESPLRWTGHAVQRTPPCPAPGRGPSRPLPVSMSPEPCEQPCGQLAGPRWPWARTTRRSVACLANSVKMTSVVVRAREETAVWRGTQNDIKLFFHFHEGVPDASARFQKAA